MSLGKVIRKATGKYFHLLGDPYRALFVDLNKVAALFSLNIPSNARCLDIGVGDGSFLNALLARRPDISVLAIDPAETAGSAIKPAFLAQVDLRPGVEIKELVAMGGKFDAIMMCDVVHHIPAPARPAFFLELAELCQAANCGLLLIKDIEPSGARAKLALLGDIYITGDRNVEQITSGALGDAIHHAFKSENILSFEVAIPDNPNYCALFRLAR
jgi:2-polyprenyl-3-methyl-5-hydroxy-6-metoxy-1,4-benzoquinol methylase